MPEVVNSAVIKAPPEKIFVYIAQAERNVEWVPDLQRSERVTPGETRIGTRFRFVTRIVGFPLDVTDEVVQLIPDRLIAFRGVTGPSHAGSWAFQPEPDGAGTLVTYRMQFELPPGIGPFVAKMIDLDGKLNEQSRACLANLRRILE